MKNDQSLLQSRGMSLLDKVLYVNYGVRSVVSIFVTFFFVSSLFAQTNTLCTVKNSYDMKPFDGPLANPHKGFTFPTGGTWCFVPEWEYSPVGSKNKKAASLITSSCVWSVGHDSSRYFRRNGFAKTCLYH